MAETVSPSPVVSVPGAAGRAAGRALRAELPRSAHSLHPGDADPKRDIVAMLEASCKGRIADLLEKELVGETRARAAALVGKARNRTHDQAFAKLVKRDAQGRWRFVDDPPRIFHHGDDEPFRATVHEVFEQYVDTIDDDRRQLFDRFRLVDFAVKAVGVGSIGRHCVMALLMSDDGQPLVMQIKQAARSVLEPYVGKSETLDEAVALYAVAYADQAERDFAIFQAAIAGGRFNAVPVIASGNAGSGR